MRILSKPVTPKQLDVFKSDLRFIRTDDIRKKENQKFRSLYPFPRSMLDLLKKKLILKQHDFLFINSFILCKSFTCNVCSGSTVGR